MKTSITSVLICALLLAACQSSPQEPIDLPEPETKPEVETPTEEITMEGVELLDMEEHFKKYRDHYLAQKPVDYVGTDQEFLNRLLSTNTFYASLTFDTGPYQGQRLVTAKLENIDAGMFSISILQRFAVDFENDVWTLLPQYSEVNENISVAAPPYSKTDTQLSVPELDVAKELDLYVSDNVLLVDETVSSISLEILQGGTKPESEIVALPNGDEAYFFNNCIYVQLVDGFFAQYAVVPDAFLSDDEELGYSSVQEMTFISNAGDAETKTFIGSYSGCGGWNLCMTQHTPAPSESDALEKVGTLDGQDALAFTNADTVTKMGTGTNGLASQVMTLYNGYKAQILYQEDQTQEPMSLQEFLDGNNTLFLELDNGNFIFAFHQVYVPPAECGKPVIYLYPEESTRVSVKVHEIDFTETIPEYREGWEVVASPNGSLFNLADQKNYPYLFWEGNSDKNFSAQPTFTLKRSEVLTQLPSILYQMGLNWKETYDFMAFWGTRILAEKSPFIEFTFVDQTLFDQIAPLEIQPQPDQVIRIFMNYKGVSEPGLSVPRFVRPERHGFTAVEWGGSL